MRGEVEAGRRNDHVAGGQCRGDEGGDEPAAEADLLLAPHGSPRNGVKAATVSAGRSSHGQWPAPSISMAAGSGGVHGSAAPRRVRVGWVVACGSGGALRYRRRIARWVPWSNWSQIASRRAFGHASGVVAALRSVRASIHFVVAPIVSSPRNGLRHTVV